MTHRWEKRCIYHKSWRGVCCWALERQLTTGAREMYSAIEAGAVTLWALRGRHCQSWRNTHHDRRGCSVAHHLR